MNKKVKRAGLYQSHDANRNRLIKANRKRQIDYTLRAKGRQPIGGLKSFTLQALANIQFSCEECSLPLDLYGENTIQQTKGDLIVTRKFCDLHAAEFLVEVKKQ